MKNFSDSRQLKKTTIDKEINILTHDIKGGVDAKIWSLALGWLKVGFIKISMSIQ